MKSKVFRFFLGLGYIILITLLLLVQAGAGAQTARWVATVEILFLAILLAVVLILYSRLSKQMSQQEDKGISTSSAGNETDYTADYAAAYERFLSVLQNTELSERELEVAWLLYRGYTNRQIGEELFIAETTVKKHVSHIYEKLDVSGRKEYKELIRAGVTVRMPEH